MVPTAFKLHAADNVATLIAPVTPGPIRLLGAVADGSEIEAREPIAAGHKVALTSIRPGAAIVKFGVRIGHATRSIAAGSWVHLHNLASDLDTRSATLDLHTGSPKDTDSAYA